MTKKTVQYNNKKEFWIKQGQSAFIFPVDHPDTERVSNTAFARTSTVVSYNEVTGIFETVNTIYIPVKEV